MKYFPRRTDNVWAIKFDGSQSSAQAVAQALGVAVRHLLPETLQVGDRGGHLLITGLDQPVKPSEYVVIGIAAEGVPGAVNQVIEVLDWRSFSDKYSKDGL